MLSTLIHRKIVTVSIWLGTLLMLLSLLAAPLAAFAEAPNTGEELVYSVVVSGFGNLMIIGGSALDSSIEYFVIEFAQLYRANFGGAIELTWGIVRDLMNFALIFGLIYVGFRFILNADEAGAKRNLVTLIIAALLVNFSLFFAKAIVDISNIAGIAFSNAISSGSTLGIAGSFADVLNFDTAFPAELATIFNDENGNERQSYWDYIFMLMVTLLVATFVFLAAAVLIMIRFIVLSFMLVFSPILVLGWIFPFFKGLSQKWFNTFLGQAFMAPAMLLCLYCSFLILNGLSSAVGGSLSSLDSSGADAGVLGSVTFFILGMGFLIGSLIIAQKMGAAGAATAVSIGRSGYRKAGQWAKYGARGTVRSAGRGAAAAGAVGMQQTRGRAAYRTLKSQKFQDKLANMSADERRKAYQKQKAKAESSYDVRNLGKYIKDKSILQTQKKGFQQKMGDREKLEKEIFKAMGAVDEKALKKNDPRRKALEKARQPYQLKLKELQTLQSDSAKVVQTHQTNINRLNNTLATASQDQKAAIEQQIQEERNKMKQAQVSGTESASKIKAELKPLKDDYEKTVREQLTFNRQITAMKNASNKYGVRKVAGQDDFLERGVRTWDGKQSIQGRMNRVLQPHVTEEERDLTEAMLKEYGRDGQEKEKNKKKEDNLKVLSEQIKESGNDTGNQNNTDNA